MRHLLESREVKKMLPLKPLRKLYLVRCDTAAARLKGAGVQVGEFGCKSEKIVARFLASLRASRAGHCREPLIFRLEDLYLFDPLMAA